jgi:hypothetical protein
MPTAREYLNPAYSLILKFADGGELSKGIDRIAKVTGTNRVSVKRWMRPKEKGGTEGLIPTRQQRKLLEYAQRASLPIEPRDFFADEARAA